MARIDIDIEDYLDEVSTSDLMSELLSRKNIMSQLKGKGVDVLDALSEDDIINYLKDHFSAEAIIKKVLNIRPWHDKKRIIEEIDKSIPDEIFNVRRSLVVSFEKQDRPEIKPEP